MDGSKIMIRTRGVVPPAHRQDWSRLIYSLEDVTEQSRAEEALRNCEERLRTITDNLPAFVAYVDRNGRYQFANHFYEDWFNRSIDEIAGYPIEDVIGPGNFAAIAETHRKALGGETVTRSGEFESKDGRKANVLAQYVPDRAPDGAVRGYYILSHDITDLTNTEKALREREEGLRLITDNVPALIAYIDSEMRYRFVNRTFEEWFQVPQASVLGMRIEDIIGAENFAKVVGHIERALAGEHVTYEETMTYAGGQKREFHAILVPDFDPQNNTVGYYALVVDVSERKKAEIALRESEESLARAQEIVHLGS